ncbi:hypothetical protein EKH79_01760 [Dyella dinghuensis]|uniref:PilY1 beta-propeller domain-containing protein n=1 Tax=Dyella dinghuensis TaxID=1920169 RepID=A0A3S0S5P6_9GAMM|nr:PilC/PilY family type IV pilus protein [Dyella dinghuensis]RUL66574.1 hypothetical protein EKH79_01760 [Dyella dinghuensis]
MATHIVKRLAFATILIAHGAAAQAVNPSGTVELSPLPLDNALATPALGILGLNTSVAGAGSLAFMGGYDPKDWSGTLQAFALSPNGVPTQRIWDANALLTDDTALDSRVIFTAVANGVGVVTGAVFEPAANFDISEAKGLMTPSPKDPMRDALSARIEYLRGMRYDETSGVMRKRNTLLGAIIHSQVLYVGYPGGRYVNDWPTKIGGKSVLAPEMDAQAQTYDQFVSANADRAPMIYVGANDGMLHAIHAPVPTCQTTELGMRCPTGSYAGQEAWAYVPRAVYSNLGRLTSTDNLPFAPTVDATPIMRDVFFGENGDHTWHSLLVGGVRLGGRGLYALDITDPTKVSRVFPLHTVLWEFDADMPSGLSAAGDEYRPADLGYTYGQPAIARLAYGRWVVLVAGGYFPDCSKPDKPAHCEEAGGTPPHGYSALFVIDAQTGSVVRELKTRTDIDGVTSYGLSTPVLGDYNNDQVDDVAFAGDLAGNLWRFDLASPNPANWKVTLAYRPVVASAQPVTVMPRLFPDPATNRFIVVFGTGKYLGDDDVTSDDLPVQSVMGIRDKLDRSGLPITVTRSDLQTQTLKQTTVHDTGGSYDGAVLRTLSNNPIPSGAGGWHVDLNAEAGERVVSTPSALFNTNTVVVSTLVPKGFDSAPEGALMAIDAATGGPGATLASIAGVSYVGAALSQSISTGMLPAITPVGGGKLLFPSLKLKGKTTMPDVPLSLESPLWRRRSWTVLTPTQ